MRRGRSCVTVGGDARKLLNILDLIISAESGNDVVITDKMVEERLQENPLAYDKMVRCTMILSRHSSSRFVAPIPMRHSTGWHA